MVDGLHLTEYEIQVLIGCTISGCNMRPDRVFSLSMAWHRLHALGLIDRTDGLAIVTEAGKATVDRIRSTLSDAVAEREAEPVASVAEVRADGQRLYNTVYPSDALDKFPIGTPLYTSPPTSELEALRKRVTELEKALDALLERWSKFEASCGNQEEAYYNLVKYARPAWEAARRVREGGKVDG